MSHFPKVPVRFIADNDELLKAQSGAGSLAGQPMTDHAVQEHIPQQNAASVHFRAPYDRVNGNVMFRRYPDGQLDVDNSVAILMRILNAQKDGAPLTVQEKLAIQCVFPTIFPHEDPSLLESLRSVNLRITPLECLMLAIECGKHLAEQENFNAGYGGGSVPGRHQTRS